MHEHPDHHKQTTTQHTIPQHTSHQERTVARSWGTIHVEVTTTIHAPRERLVALNLDHEHWTRLFSATIRGVRLIESGAGRTIVEVDHRTAGRVINILRRRSASEIELEEFKPRYDATFLNRFDAVADGTRYTVIADVRLKMPYALLAPVLRPYARRAVRRYVLEPMRAHAERHTST